MTGEEPLVGVRQRTAVGIVGGLASPEVTGRHNYTSSRQSNCRCAFPADDDHIGTAFAIVVSKRPASASVMT